MAWSDFIRSSSNEAFQVKFKLDFILNFDTLCKITVNNLMNVKFSVEGREKIIFVFLYLLLFKIEKRRIFIICKLT